MFIPTEFIKSILYSIERRRQILSWFMWGEGCRIGLGGFDFLLENYPLCGLIDLEKHGNRAQSCSIEHNMVQLSMRGYTSKEG